MSEQTPADHAPIDHAASGSIEIIPIPGLPRFNPGDDLAAALAEAAGWIRDGDILVVTSKIISKIEGRIVPAPPTPTSATLPAGHWSTPKRSACWRARTAR